MKLGRKLFLCFLILDAGVLVSAFEAFGSSSPSRKDLPQWIQSFIPEHASIVIYQYSNQSKNEAEIVLLGYTILSLDGIYNHQKTIVLMREEKDGKILWEDRLSGQFLDTKSGFYSLSPNKDSEVLLVYRYTGASIGGGVTALALRENKLKPVPGLRIGVWGLDVEDLDSDGNQEVIITDRYAPTWKRVFSYSNGRFIERTSKYPSVHSKGVPAKKLESTENLFKALENGTEREKAMAIANLTLHPKLSESKRYEICVRALNHESNMIRRIALNRIRVFDFRADETAALLDKMLDPKVDPIVLGSAIRAAALIGDAGASVIPKILSLRKFPGLCWDCPIPEPESRRENPSLLEATYWSLRFLGPKSVSYLGSILDAEDWYPEELSEICEILQSYAYEAQSLLPILSQLLNKYPEQACLKDTIKIITASQPQS